MRTTLKRGVGRSAAANGNGHAVLPPGPLAPIVRYEQPRPRRGVLKVLVKTLFALAALALMVATAAVAGTWLYGEDTVSQLLPPKTVETAITRKTLAIPVPGKPAIALVLGYDKRFKGSGAGEPSRSDTIMLIRMDPENKTMTLLSFPRDLQVPLYCPGHEYLPDRINAAWALGGPKCTVDTVKHLTGLSVNYLVTVNFKGFVQVVDKLNGIWMDVDRRYYHVNDGGYDNYASINLQPGYQKLYGSAALSFVRYRHTDSDLVRNARQQLFVRAVKDRITHDFHASTIPKVVGALRKNIDVYQGGHDIDLKTVISWALLAYEMPSGNVERVKIDNITGAGVPGDPLLAPTSSIQAAVQQFLNPDVEAPTKAAAAALGEKPKLKHGLAPSQVSIVALNGNAVPGAAANATAQLQSHEYRTLLPPDGLQADAPTFDYFRSEVYYRTSMPRSKAAAQQVANLFGSADIQPMPLDQSAASKKIRRLSHGAMLVVVVGKTFKGNLAPAPKDTTPPRTPPVVMPSDTALPYLRTARHYVPFRLQNPSVIERNSVIDSEKPVRVYTISGKYKAVRLTFHTYGYQYWGIEETNWTDAPVFAAANETRKLKGRTYQLYFSGSHLHMVVLRDGDRSYWVVNTLNDDLSNETMLAIARGLKPMKPR
jgi:LCP family protein required for cell wall assembly